MNSERIFGCTHEFVARERELEQIITAAHAGQSRTILAPPGSGASELLKQAYDELFRSESLVPFYFELKRSDRDARSAAQRFATEFLGQFVAFSRRDPQILWSHPGLEELCRLVDPGHAFFIDDAIEAMRNATLEVHLALPARSTARVCVLLDGLDRCRLIREGGQFLQAIERLGSSNVSVIASGLRRAMYGRLPFHQLGLSPLRADDAAAVTGVIAEYNSVALSDATRDLISVQTESSVAAAALLIAQAADDGEDLSDFAGVERTYTNSLFGGLLTRYLRRRLLAPLPGDIDQNDAIRFLAGTLGSEGRRVPMPDVRRAMADVDPASFGKLIRHLHVEEALSAGDGFVDMSATSRVVCDYVEARSSILVQPEKRSLTVGRSMQSNFRRATRLMTEAYRMRAALGVRELLTSFRGQKVAGAAIDYGSFKKEFKGQEEEKVFWLLANSTPTIQLPRILYTADAVSYYPPIAELSDRNRSAVGIAETGEAWFIAQVDSKLEADVSTAEFWCDRLEMAAVNCGIENFRIWLIAPEGFNEEAVGVLRERSAYGSSRKQIHMLRRLMNDPPLVSETPATVYEITVPMGDEGDLLAARTLNEISEKHSLPEKVVGKIKAALVEALINSAEHSLSPDRTTRLTFSVTDDDLTITVQNRGVKLTEQMLVEANLDSERRGWGLELIRRLMDDVHIEPTDDGTRLVMSKNTTPPIDPQN